MTYKKYGPTLQISEEIHSMKYRLPSENFYESQNRFSSELGDNNEHRRAFRDCLINQRFLGAGRVQAAIGSPRKVTAFNCFVSGTIHDSFSDIMDKCKDAGQTMQLGGGIGYDFSTLRPKGARIKALRHQLKRTP